jgi:hypothetical protein
VKALEGELGMIGANVGLQMNAKDELIMQLQKQIDLWKNKYDALAKLYSQLRGEHLDLLNKTKGFQLKASSAQEAVDKMERMDRDVKAKNLELADMIRERDRARYDIDRLKSVRNRIDCKGDRDDKLTCTLLLFRATVRKLIASSETWPLPTSEPKMRAATRVPKSRACWPNTTVN